MPFASSILVSLNRKLREKTIYTAHMDEYRLELSKFTEPPLMARFLSRFVPDEESKERSMSLKN